MPPASRRTKPGGGVGAVLWVGVVSLELLLDLALLDLEEGDDPNKPLFVLFSFLARVLLLALLVVLPFPFTGRLVAWVSWS